MNSDLTHEIRILAYRAYHRLATANSTALCEQIVETAQETGELSIWLEAFADNPTMCQKLRQAFTQGSSEQHHGNEVDGSQT